MMHVIDKYQPNKKHPSVYAQQFSESKLKEKNTSFYKIQKLITTHPSTILDVGCSTGYFGRYLKKKYNCTVWGVEINKTDAQESQKWLDRVITTNLENEDTPKRIFGNIKFDLIICADVIEHLVDPWSFLLKLKSLLTPQGVLIASIPNVSHYSIKLGLINNTWEYQNSGLMDRTHLHFFTYREIINLFNKNNFHIKKVLYTTSEIHPQHLNNLIIESGLDLNSSKLVNNLSTFESHVFQYIVKATINRKSKTHHNQKPKKLSLIPRRYKIVSGAKAENMEIKLLRQRNLELQKSLDSITSAKTFKLWQFLVRLKKDLQFTTRRVSEVYNEEFFRHITSLEQPSATDFATILIKKFQPQSVIDFGCGNGVYLKEFINQNIKAIGIDGSKNAITCSLVDINLIKLHDLTKPINLHQKYDLAICIEVAEHLPQDKSHVLIQNIIRHSDTIAFTAATPGQGGVDHQNEQPQKYWINIFKLYGYRLNQAQTKQITSQFSKKQIIWWITKNLMIFEKDH